MDSTLVYTVLAGALLALAFVVILLAAKILFRGHWFLSWLKGMAGLCLVVVAVFLTLAALDFYSYKTALKEQPIATLSFSRLGTQLYKVSLVQADGIEQSYELKGDLWQLDARILKWNSMMNTLGVNTGYRLDRLSGRYYSLEEETNAERTVYELASTKNNLDIWQLINQAGNQLGFVDARYGSATYLPMHDGALFTVMLTHNGLLARPINDRAREVVQAWQ